MTEARSITARASDAIGRINVRSALNPILWLCGLVTVPGLVLASLLPETPNWLVAIIVAPVAVAIVGFVYLLFTDPDRLQSESYQLRKQALELIEEKGDPRIIDATAVALVSNPELRALPEPEVEEGL